MKRKALLLLIPLVASGLAGCNQNKPNPDPGPDPGPQPSQCDTVHVTLSETAFELEEEKTKQLTATVNPAACPVVWSSNHPEIASVDQTGLVTAVSEGEATITVGDASCVVTVTAKDPGPGPGPTPVEGMQAAYEAAAALQNSTSKDRHPSESEYSFGGVVVGTRGGKDFFVQKDGYGLDVYGEPEGFAYGKEVSVTATLIKFSGTLETDAISSATVVGDGQLPNAVVIDSASKLASTNQNILANVEGVIKTMPSVVASSDLKIILTVGDSDVTVFLKKNTFASKVDLLNGLKVGDTLKVSNAITGAYNDDKQLLVCDNTVLEKEAAPEKEVTAVVSVAEGHPTEVTVGGSIALSDVLLNVTYSDGQPGQVNPTDISFDNTKEATGVEVTCSYNEVGSAKFSIDVVAEAPKVAGDFYRIKSNDEIQAGTYLIGYEASDTEVKLHSGVDATEGGYIDAAMSDGHIEANSTFTKFTLEDMEGGFALKVVGGTNDGKYLSGKASSNTTVVGTEKALNTITHSDDGDLIVSNTSTMMFNKASDQMRFRYYKAGTTTQQAVHLYKMHEGEPAELVSISVDSSQVKKEYYVGDSLDTTNLIVTGHYDDGNDKIITSGYEIDPESFEEAGDSVAVTISYNGENAEPFNVKVNAARTLTSIKFGGSMSDLEYNEGESYNPAGLKVVGVYNDLSEDDLDADDYVLTCNPEKASVGDTSVVVTATVEGFDPITTTVEGITVSEITPIVLPGTYYIGSNGKYLVKNSDSSKQPLCVATTDEATPFDFVLESGTSDQYKIKVHGEDSYLYLTATNNGVKIGKTQMVWTIGEGTCKDIVGGYNLTAKDSNNAVRVLTCYQGTDFRCYELKADGSATNRTDNTFLTAAVEKTLESISVTSQPTKDSYYVGETFDPAGLVVKAHYVWDGGSEDKEITEYSLSVSGAFVEEDVGTKTITVTFGEKTTTFDVTVAVREATLSSISIDGEPTKTEYKVGEDYSADGLSVTAHYSDESTSDLTGSVTISINKETAEAGDTSITYSVSYEGKNASKDVDVTVVVPQVSNFAKATKLEDLIVNSKVIVAARESAYAISTTQNGNNRGKTDIVKTTDGKLETPGEDVEVFTLEEGTVSGTIALKCTTGYLYAVKGQNYLRTQTDKKADGDFIATFDDQGNIKLEAAVDTTDKRIIQYNESGMFSCYKGSQKDIDLFIEPYVEPTEGLKSISVSGPTKTEYNVNDSFDPAGLVVTASYYGDTPDADVTASATYDAPDMTSKGAKEIVVSYTEGDVTKTDSFTITVKSTTKEEFTDTFKPSDAEGAPSSYTTDGTEYVFESDSAAYAMTGINSSDAIRGNKGANTGNFNLRSTTAVDGYYIKSVVITLKEGSTGTIDVATENRSVLILGSSVFGKITDATVPQGTQVAGSVSNGVYTWENTDMTATSFILYNLKTSGTFNAASITITWAPIVVK